MRYAFVFRISASSPFPLFSLSGPNSTKKGARVIKFHIPRISISKLEKSFFAAKARHKIQRGLVNLVFLISSIISARPRVEKS